MKHLHKLNELIRIDKFSLDKLSHLVGQILSYKSLLNSINTELESDKIFFMDRNDFIPWFNENLSDQPPPPPMQATVHVGINFLAYFPQASEDVLVITKKGFERNFKTLQMFESFKKRIEPLIVHELIHTKQAAQKGLDHIPNADVSNFADYVSEPDELMAWSNTIAHEIFAVHDKMPKDLVDAIKRSGSGRMVMQHIKQDNPARKRFFKYIYQYLDEMFDKEKENPIKNTKSIKNDVKPDNVQAAIDNALDNGNYDEVKRLSKYL